MGGDFGLTRMTMSIIRAAQRDSERQRKHELKMQAFKTALGEVKQQEYYIQYIISLHKQCSSGIDWKKIADTTPPIKPIKTNQKEVQARSRFENYVPGFWIKLLNLTKYRINQLKLDIERAKSRDEVMYEEAVGKFNEEQKRWEEETEFAKKILSGNLELYKSMIKELSLWMELKEVGQLLDIEVRDSKRIEISIKENRACIPQHRKRALKRGGVSLTNMPISLYNEICHNYICSSAIRIIREIFAILPVDIVQVNIISDFVHMVTGHPENHPILSIRISRDRLNNIQWDNMDPVNFISASEHRMNFKKTKGFSAVIKL